MFFVQNGPGEPVEAVCASLLPRTATEAVSTGRRWPTTATSGWCGDCYGARILDGDGGDVTRSGAVREFRQLFDPGDVVDGAIRPMGGYKPMVPYFGGGQANTAVQ
ncbi:MAG: hypothetical protein R2856_28860 [Caldilineaceae bacterium]